MVNPDYVEEVSVNTIQSKIKLITLGCKSKCNCKNQGPIMWPTTTTTSTIAPITTTTSTTVACRSWIYTVDWFSCSNCTFINSGGLNNSQPLTVGKWYLYNGTKMHITSFVVCSTSSPVDSILNSSAANTCVDLVCSTTTTTTSSAGTTTTTTSGGPTTTTSSTTVGPTTTTSSTTASPTTTTSTTLAPVTTTTTTTTATRLAILGQTDSLCNLIGGVRVITSVPVKINMTGTFGVGGFYYTDTGFVSTDIVNQVVSTQTIFNFGIEASNGGPLLNTSSIHFTINDFDTDAIIDQYTMIRVHANSPC
jgi:hypothetical protein